MGIRDWPADEQPQAKLLEYGAGSLSSAELLSVLLRTGLPGGSAVDLARDALSHFDGLRGLLEAELPRFCETQGLGETRYAELQAALEMGRRYLAEGLKRGDALKNPTDTRRYLQACLRGHQREVFAALFLDNRHRVIGFEELFLGTIDGATVHPREVVKRALARNAAAVIVAHNHPSGVAEPSPADRAITRRLRDALALVDIRLLDHVVVGDGEPVSLAEMGLL